MIIITFLGTGNYTEVTYKSNDVIHGNIKTNLFPYALATWYQPSKVFVLLTEQAASHNNWKDLQSHLDQLSCTHIPVSIPDGKSERELWGIFDKITESVTSDDEIIFDITHGFRSLPVISLLAAAYLREAKRINLKHIFYGAYEAKDDNNIAPVFDLTPFLDLLRWASATNVFLHSGDASQLGQMLSDIQVSAKRENQAVPPPSKLRTCGEAFQNLSEALNLTRPDQIQKHSSKLLNCLDTASEEFETFARPFQIIRDGIKIEFRQFASSPLQSQQNLIKWYLEHNRILQAVTLAREWLITWIIKQIGRSDSSDERRDMTDTLNYLASRKGDTKKHGFRFKEDIRISLKDKADWINLWSDISSLRNDLAHCGINENPRKLTKILTSAKDMIDKLLGLDASDSC